MRQGNLFAVCSGKECETGKPICCLLWKRNVRQGNICLRSSLEKECETGKHLFVVFSGKECETGKHLFAVFSGKECETGNHLFAVFSGKGCETGKYLSAVCILWKGM